MYIHGLVVVPQFELLFYPDVDFLMALAKVEVGVRMLHTVSVLPDVKAEQDKLLGDFIRPDFA